jgi:serine/threonine protein kinase
VSGIGQRQPGGQGFYAFNGQAGGGDGMTPAMGKLSISGTQALSQQQQLEQQMAARNLGANAVATAQQVFSQRMLRGTTPVSIPGSPQQVAASPQQVPASPQQLQRPSSAKPTSLPQAAPMSVTGQQTVLSQQQQLLIQQQQQQQLAAMSPAARLKLVWRNTPNGPTTATAAALGSPAPSQQQQHQGQGQQSNGRPMSAAAGGNGATGHSPVHNASNNAHGHQGAGDEAITPTSNSSATSNLFFDNNQNGAGSAVEGGILFQPPSAGSPTRERPQSAKGPKPFSYGANGTANSLGGAFDFNANNGANSHSHSPVQGASGRRSASPAPVQVPMDPAVADMPDPSDPSVQVQRQARPTTAPHISGSGGFSSNNADGMGANDGGNQGYGTYGGATSATTISRQRPQSAGPGRRAGSSGMQGGTAASGSSSAAAPAPAAGGASNRSDPYSSNAPTPNPHQSQGRPSTAKPSGSDANMLADAHHLAMTAQETEILDQVGVGEDGDQDQNGTGEGSTGNGGSSALASNAVSNDPQTRKQQQREREWQARQRLKAFVASDVFDGRATVDFYGFGKVLGQGSFGEVRLAWHRLAGAKVAIKSYEKTRITDPAQWRRVQQEIDVLHRLNNPFCLRMFETIDTPKRIHIVTEFCGGGNLCTYVKAKGRLSEAEARKIFIQLLTGIEYLHAQGIIHRDIKLENVLFDDETRDVVKLVDFGFAVVVRDPWRRLRIFCGTPSYMAPEICQRREYHGRPVDVWSLAVLLYAMIVGRFPFSGKTYPELYKRIAAAQVSFPDHMSGAARDLLRRMLNPDPNRRLTLALAKSHPWIAPGLPLSIGYNLGPPEEPAPLGPLPDKSLLVSGDAANDINEAVLQRSEYLGYKRTQMLSTLLSRERNACTTTYYLLLSRIGRSAKASSSSNINSAANGSSAERSARPGSASRYRTGDSAARGGAAEPNGDQSSHGSAESSNLHVQQPLRPGTSPAIGANSYGTANRNRPASAGARRLTGAVPASSATGYSNTSGGGYGDDAGGDAGPSERPQSASGRRTLTSDQGGNTWGEQQHEQQQQQQQQQGSYASYSQGGVFSSPRGHQQQQQQQQQQQRSDSAGKRPATVQGSPGFGGIGGNAGFPSAGQVRVPTASAMCNRGGAGIPVPPSPSGNQQSNGQGIMMAGYGTGTVPGSPQISVSRRPGSAGGVRRPATTGATY